MNPVVFVADRLNTVFSKSARRALPQAVVSPCPHCMQFLLVPPCAEKQWIIGTSNVIFCFQCARKHHPEASVFLMGCCSMEKKLIKAQAEMN